MGPSGTRPSKNALVFLDENFYSDKGNDGAIETACKRCRYEGEYSNRGSRDSSAARMPTSSKAPWYSLNTFKLRISIPRLQAYLNAQKFCIVQNNSELNRCLPPFDLPYYASGMTAIFSGSRLRKPQHLPATAQRIPKALWCRGALFDEFPLAWRQPDTDTQRYRYPPSNTYTVSLHGASSNNPTPRNHDEYHHNEYLPVR